MIDMPFTMAELNEAEAALRKFVELCHRANKRWWQNPATGEPIQRNVGELLMLQVSEIAEGMEGHRKNRMDDHLPQFPSLVVEQADAMIRIGDLAGGLDLDLAAAWKAKMLYNARRKDHTHAERLKPGGKIY